jgi:starch synthase (maltosyl-transferring)
VVANLDPHAVRGSTLTLDLPALGLGLGWGDRFRARDLVTGADWVWDDRPYVQLGPGYGHEPVHIIWVTRD